MSCLVLRPRKHGLSPKSQKGTERTRFAPCRLAPAGFVGAGRRGLRGEAGVSLAGLVPLPQAAAAVAKAGKVQASEHPLTPGQT